MGEDMASMIVKGVMRPTTNFELGLGGEDILIVLELNSASVNKPVLIDIRKRHWTPGMELLPQEQNQCTLAERLRRRLCTKGAQNCTIRANMLLCSS